MNIHTQMIMIRFKAIYSRLKTFLGSPDKLVVLRELIGAISSMMKRVEYAKMKECPEMS